MLDLIADKLWSSLQNFPDVDKAVRNPLAKRFKNKNIKKHKFLGKKENKYQTTPVAPGTRPQVSAIFMDRGEPAENFFPATANDGTVSVQ